MKRWCYIFQVQKRVLNSETHTHKLRIVERARLRVDECVTLAAGLLLDSTLESTTNTQLDVPHSSLPLILV